MKPENKTEKVTKSKFKPMDITHVYNPDPNYTYRWLNYTNFSKQGNRDFRGYEIVNASNATTELLKAPETEFKTGDYKTRFSPEIRGDLILARIHKDKYQDQKEYYLEKAYNYEKRIKKPSSEFSSEVNATVSGEYKMGEVKEKF